MLPVKSPIFIGLQPSHKNSICEQRLLVGFMWVAPNAPLTIGEHPYDVAFADANPPHRGDKAKGDVYDSH